MIGFSEQTVQGNVIVCMDHATGLQECVLLVAAKKDGKANHVTKVSH